MAIDKAVDSAALDAGLKQIADAIRAKGGTSAQLAFPAAMAEAVAAIQSGGGGILLPAGAQISVGSYTPVESGTGFEHTIKVAKNLDNSYPYKNVLVFAIYRSDGLFADGADDTRYIRSYFGASVKGGNGCGFVQYRNNRSSGVSTCGAGVETPNAKSYGVPNTGETVRSNTFVKKVESNGNLTFSSYGIVCLEPSKEYKWFAIIEEGAEL